MPGCSLNSNFQTFFWSNAHLDDEVILRHSFLMKDYVKNWFLLSKNSKIQCFMCYWLKKTFYRNCWRLYKKILHFKIFWWQKSIPHMFMQWKIMSYMTISFKNGHLAPKTFKNRHLTRKTFKTLYLGDMQASDLNAFSHSAT